MLLYYFLPFYLIYATLVFFLRLNHKLSLLFTLKLSYYQLIDGFYYFLLLISCIYLYRKTPNWEDHCFIRSEMRLTYFVWCTCLSLYVMLTLIFICLEIADVGDEYVQSIIAVYIGLILLLLYGMLLMWYPINKIDVKPADLSRATSPDQIQMVWNAQKKNKRFSDVTHNHSTRIKEVCTRYVLQSKDAMSTLKIYLLTSNLLSSAWHLYVKYADKQEEESIERTNLTKLSSTWQSINTPPQ